MKLLSHMIGRNQGWIRLCGVGLLWKHDTIPPLASERLRFTRFVHIPGTPWRVRVLWLERITTMKQKEHQRPTHCYKGRCRGCGAVLASAYDMIEAPKETGEMVADMVRSGLIVAHEPFPGAAMSDCTCPKPEQPEQQAQLL